MITFGQLAISNAAMVAAVVVLEDYLVWLQQSNIHRSDWKGWTYPAIMFVLATIRQLLENKARLSIVLSAQKLNVSLRVFYF